MTVDALIEGVGMDEVRAFLVEQNEQGCASGVRPLPGDLADLAMAHFPEFHDLPALVEKFVRVGLIRFSGDSIRSQRRPSGFRTYGTSARSDGSRAPIDLDQMTLLDLEDDIKHRQNEIDGKGTELYVRKLLRDQLAAHPTGTRVCDVFTDDALALIRKGELDEQAA